MVAVAWEQHLLDRAERVLQSWTAGDMSEAETELLTLRQAVAKTDWDTVERYGGLNATLKKMNELAQESPVSNGRGMIDDFHLRGSRRCRRRVSALQTWGRTPRPDMISTTTMSLSQRAEPSLLGSKASPKRRTRSGTTRISHVSCDQPTRGSASRVPLPRAAAARRTGGILVVGATLYLSEKDLARIIA